MELAVGDIFKITLFPTDGVKPKNDGEKSRTKYIVIVGIDDEKILVGSVLINSKINEHLFSIIGPYQHRILPENYIFLTKKESYIDCFKIKEIPYKRLLDSAEYIGSLSEDDFLQISKLIVSSPANKKHILKKYLLTKF